MEHRMFKTHFNTTFETIAERVNEIASTESTIEIDAASTVCDDVSRYTDFGLNTLGKTLGFPAQFIRTVNETNPGLASEIINDRAELYFGNGDKSFFEREFLGQICGIVSNKYVFFDDAQVIDIIENSPLAELSYAHAQVTPERLHLRAIEEDSPFKVNDDGSPLYFCYFIDNSMVGMSSFKVQLGVYRLACTNGLILPIQEFVICKQVHRGSRDICAEFNASIAFLKDKREALKSLVCDLSKAESALETMKEDYRTAYLCRVLNISQKESEKVLNLYKQTYGGKTKWDLVNAITEFARDTNAIDRREYLEKKALKVA